MCVHIYIYIYIYIYIQREGESGIEIHTRATGRKLDTQMDIERCGRERMLAQDSQTQKTLEFTKEKFK